MPAIWKVLPALENLKTGFVLAANGGDKHGSRSGSEWYSRGMDLHNDEHYDQAIEAFQKAIEAGYREGASSYNIACGYALKGNTNEAFEWLERAADEGLRRLLVPRARRRPRQPEVGRPVEGAQEDRQEEGIHKARRREPGGRIPLRAARGEGGQERPAVF